MFKKSSRFSLLVLFLLFTTLLSASPAHALVTLSGVGALQSETGKKTGYGGGLLLDFHMVARIHLELGGVFISNKPSAVYVPADLRLYLTRRLSLSAGGYYEHFSDTSVSARHSFEGGVRLGLSRFFIDGRYLGGAEHSLMGLLGIHL